MKKKILSVILTLTLVLTMMPSSTAFAGTEKVQFSVEASNMTPNAKDEVTFTVYYEASETCTGFQFDLDIPTGLTYVTSSGALESEFKNSANAESEASFTELTKRVIAGSLSGLTLNQKIAVMKFKCTVDDGVSGVKNITLKDISGTGENFTELSESDFKINSADVNIPKTPITSVTASVTQPAKGNPLATTVDIGSATSYTAEAPVWYKGSGIAGDTATGNADASQVYTVKVTLKADTTKGENFATSGLTVPTGYDVVSNDGTTLVLKKTFDATDARTLTALEITEYTGGVKKHGDTISKDELTVKATFDSGSPDADYKNYEIVYKTGSALTKGDTTFKVKNGSVESGNYTLGTAVAGKALTAEAFTFTAPSLIYDGTNQIAKIQDAVSAKKGVGTPTFTVKKGNETVAEAKNAGEYKLLVSALEGTEYAAGSDIELGTVTIQPKSISGAVITFGTQATYDGTAKDVEITSVMDGGNALTKDTDYTITSGGIATNVEEQTLTITGKGNYTGTATSATKWKLSPKAVDASMIAPVSDATYTGSAITPKPAITDGTALTEGTDFDYSYEDNTNAGTAKVKITGKGNYTGTAEKTFVITAADQKPTITASRGLQVGGSTLDLNSLVKGVGGGADVTFTIASGDAATLSGSTLTSDVTKTGEVKITVTIAAKDVNNDGEDEYKAYTGTEAITVTVNDKNEQAALTMDNAASVIFGNTLTLSTSGGSGTGAVSYEIITGGTGGATISGNVLTPTKAGTVKVCATKAADDNYNEAISDEFEITIEQATPTGIPAYTKITVDGKTLAEAALAVGTLNPSAGELKWVDDSDANLPAGTIVEKNKAYKWKFTPTDTNYKTVSGTITLYSVTSGGGISYIPPATDSLPAVKTESTKAVESYVKPADYEDAEAAEIKAIMDKAAADIKNAKTEEEVKAIEAAAKAEIDKLETAEEKAVIRTVEATKFKAVSKVTKLNGKKAIKITWNVPADMEFDGFEVYRSTKKNSGFGKKPIFTTTKRQYTNNKGLKKGKTYYYKVRAYKYVNDEKVYTEYSFKAIRTLK